MDGPTFKFDVRWTPEEQDVRCKIPKRPLRGGGSWGIVAGAVDGELIAELGRRRGFAAEFYESFSIFNAQVTFRNHVRLHCAQAGTSAFGAS